jgi:hypothetical protein
VYEALPDLTAVDGTATATARLGTSIDLTYGLRNGGLIPAGGTWTDRVYVSRTSTLDAAAVAIGDLASGVPNPLAVGSTVSRTVNLTLPERPDIPTGAVYLLVKVDADNAIAEMDNTNNVVAIPITLTVTRPELVGGATQEQATLRSRSLVFTQALDATIGLGTLTLTGPGGRTVPITGTAGSGTTWSVTFAPQVEPGSYVLSGGAEIKNTLGIPIDGGFTDTFTLLADTTAPRVTGFLPLGPQRTDVSALRVSFDESIRLASIPATAIQVIGPNGTIAASAVGAVTGTQERQFDVAIPTQSAEGTYTIVLADPVGDLAGNAIGGPRSFSFTIDKTGPKVTAVSPPGTLAAAVDHVDVTFTVKLGRLRAADVAITGPGGAVTIGTPTLLAGTTWRIPVSGVALNGPYSVAIGTGTTDLAGNGLDQDGDGTPNAFNGSFTLAVPDLLVEDLASPTTAAAGQTVAVSWTTRNAGAAAGALATTEEVWLSDDATIGNDRFLGSFSFADLGQRTVNVTIPAYGPASGGAVRLVVKTAAAGWTELDTGNNASIAVTPIDLPLGLTLSLAASQVAETGQPVTATVCRNGPTTQALVVTLASSDVGEATVPASVTIPAPQSAATFSVTPVADGITDGPQAVALSATATGFAAGGAALTVIDVDLPGLTISAAPGELAEGRAGTATVTRSVVTGEPLVVMFSSAAPQQIAAPGTVVIPANQASATFTITTVNNSIPEPAEAVVLVASAAGHDPASVTVTVIDDDLPTLTLELDRTTLEKGVDGPGRALVRRAVATSQPLTVRIIVGNPARLLALETNEIPANQTTAAFWLLAVDDTLANGTADVSVTVAGVYPLTGGTIATGQATGTITVRDDDGPKLTVSLDRTVVRAGLAAAANGRVTRSGSTAGALVVTLASSDTSEATVPATVTIPDGAASATFVVTSVADALADGSQPVVISAAAEGLRNGSATLLVTEAELPDLVIRDLAVPATAYTESLQTVSWRIDNLGTGRAAGTMTQQVWLSRDKVPGNDQFLGNYPFTGVLDHAGEFNWFGQSVPVRMPVEAGSWWIIVTADALETVTEGFEANNTVVAVTPIAVVPAYSAMVQTALDVAPAGTPVVFTGEALQTGSGARAPFVPVSVTLTVRGVTRTLLAVTDVTPPQFLYQCS